MSNDRLKGSKKTKKCTTSPRSVGFKYFETEKILKILKKNNHPELYVARHKFIQSFFRFYKNDITQDAKTEVGEDERC